MDDQLGHSGLDIGNSYLVELGFLFKKNILSREVWVIVEKKGKLKEVVGGRVRRTKVDYTIWIRY